MPSRRLQITRVYTDAKYVYDTKVISFISRKKMNKFTVMAFPVFKLFIMPLDLALVIPRTYMHWTAVSAARGASRAAELAAKVTSAQDVLPTSGLLATAMEMPNIDRILAVNITV